MYEERSSYARGTLAPMEAILKFHNGARLSIRPD